MPAVFLRKFLYVLMMSSLVPALAQAHPEHSLLASGAIGFLHPLTGIDHLLAMFAVGLWAARLDRSAIWLLPAAFPVAMLGGACLSTLGFALPAIEPMIAISVMVLGVLVAVGARIATGASVAIIATFALFHGHAHALEAPAGNAWMYGMGFLSATVLLHLAGVAAGRLIARRARIAAIGGSAIALTGFVFLLT